MSGRGGLIHCWALVYLVSFQSPQWTVYLCYGQPTFLQLFYPGSAFGPLQKQSLSGSHAFRSLSPGQDFKCLQFGLIPGVSHSKYSCIFQLHTLALQPTPLWQQLFALLTEQLDGSSVPFRFSPQMPHIGTLRSPKSCVSTARPGGPH